MIDNFRRFALLLVLAAAPARPADDWPMYLYDPTHSSFNPSGSRINSENTNNLLPAWTSNFSAPIASAPTSSAGIAYIGAWPGSLYAVDAPTRAGRWPAHGGRAAY